MAVLDDSVVDEPSGGAWRSSSLAFAISLVTCCQMASLLATQVSRTSGPRPGVESTEEWGRGWGGGRMGEEVAAAAISPRLRCIGKE